MIDEKTFYRAVNISGNNLVYRFSNGSIDYDSWLEETMLYKPYHLQYVLKYIFNSESIDVREHVKDIIIKRNILKILENNYKIAFANKNQNLYKEVKNRIIKFV